MGAFWSTPAHTCACFTTFEESLCHHRGATYWLNTWLVDFIILPLSKEEEEKWPSMLTVIQCTLPPCLATVVVLKCWITWTMCNGSYRTSSYFTTLWRQFRDFSSSSSFTFFNIPHILLKTLLCWFTCSVYIHCPPSTSKDIEAVCKLSYASLRIHFGSQEKTFLPLSLLEKKNSEHIYKSWVLTLSVYLTCWDPINC